jgi:putative FmdB family regulatory protein
LPTYQYRCTECGHTFEEFQSFTDDALSVCPVCAGRLRKVFNAVGVVFKGSGFYRNDSRTTADDKKSPATSTGSTGDSSTSTASSSSSSGSDSGSSSGTSGTSGSSGSSGDSSTKAASA